MLSLPTSQFRVFQGYQLFNTSLIGTRSLLTFSCTYSVEKEVQLGSYIVAYSPTPLLHSMLSINAMDHDNEAAKSPADNTEKGADQITLDEPVTRTTEDMYVFVASIPGFPFLLSGGRAFCPRWVVNSSLLLIRAVRCPRATTRPCKPARWSERDKELCNSNCRYLC